MEHFDAIVCGSGPAGLAAANDLDPEQAVKMASLIDDFMETP